MLKVGLNFALCVTKLIFDTNQQFATHRWVRTSL